VVPVALYTSILGPVKPNPTAEETRAWRERFLGLVKSLGFNTVAGWVPPEMVTLAEQKGLYAIVDTGFAKQMGQQGLTEQAAADLCRRVSSGYQQNKNVIAAFLNTDPVEPGWFDNWRLLGKAWNDLCPDVPLLATYDNAALWRKFDEAAPLGAAQGWCYVFGEGRNTEQALTPPVCTHLECRDARAGMPGLPVWAWMPGILKGWGMREPSLAEMSAVHYLALTEGIRGAVLFPFLAPSKTGERYLADEKGEPIPLLLAMGPMLRDFAKMGAALLPYEVRNDLACTVEGKAAAGLYVDRDGKPKYLMVASRDVAATQKVKVTFPAQGQTIAKLTDFATSAGLAARAEGGRVVCEVELPPASGRLLAIGAAAAP
jgi:hypothetical protein